MVAVMVRVNFNKVMIHVLLLGTVSGFFLSHNHRLIINTFGIFSRELALSSLVATSICPNTSIYDFN